MEAGVPLTPRFGFRRLQRFEIVAHRGALGTPPGQPRPYGRCSWGCAAPGVFAFAIGSIVTFQESIAARCFRHKWRNIRRLIGHNMPPEGIFDKKAAPYSARRARRGAIGFRQRSMRSDRLSQQWRKGSTTVGEAWCAFLRRTQIAKPVHTGGATTQGPV